MKKTINISLIIILFSSCAMPKKINTAVLEGQTWSVVSEIGPGTGSGNSWKFLPKNRFTETDWYSGGAYWTHHYTGNYFYDADNKAVLIKYDKHPYLKHVLKKRLSLKITENDTILIVTSNLKIHDTVFRNYTFKIERQ